MVVEIKGEANTIVSFARLLQGNSLLSEELDEVTIESMVHLRCSAERETLSGAETAKKACSEEVLGPPSRTHSAPPQKAVS